MRHFPTGLVIGVFALIVAIIGWQFSMPAEFKLMRQVAATQRAKSEIYARLTIQYDKPPIYEEEYRMQDIEGVSSFDYRVRGYAGKQIIVSDDKHPRIDVSSFCGVAGTLDQAGIWQMVDKAPRPEAEAHYTIYVKQVADFKQGDRIVTFTSPEYWATTAGRQFRIDLSKVNPNQLLSLKSTALADPRYQQVVDDFRAFGPDFFRAAVAEARKNIETSK